MTPETRDALLDAIAFAEAVGGQDVQAAHTLVDSTDPQALLALISGFDSLVHILATDVVALAPQQFAGPRDVLAAIRHRILSQEL